jgi:hypothetical protein
MVKYIDNPPLFNPIYESEAGYWNKSGVNNLNYELPDKSSSGNADLTPE